MQEQRRFKVVKHSNIPYFLVYSLDNTLWEEIIYYIPPACLCSTLFSCNELLMTDEPCIKNDSIDHPTVSIKKPTSVMLMSSLLFLGALGFLFIIPSPKMSINIDFSSFLKCAAWDKSHRFCLIQRMQSQWNSIFH